MGRDHKPKRMRRRVVMCCLAVFVGAVLSFASSWVCEWFDAPVPSYSKARERRDTDKGVVWNMGFGPTGALLVVSNSIHDEYAQAPPSIEVGSYPWWIPSVPSLAHHFEGRELMDLGVVAMHLRGFPVPCVATVECVFCADWNDHLRCVIYTNRGGVQLPCLIVPWLFAANTAVWTGVVMLGWIGVPAVARRLRRRSPDACTTCGYDLRGIATPLCPECGTERERRDAGEVSACAGTDTPAPPL